MKILFFPVVKVVCGTPGIIAEAAVKKMARISFTWIHSHSRKKLSQEISGSCTILMKHLAKS